MFHPLQLDNIVHHTLDIAVTCKCGWKGENINARIDDSTKRYIIQGSGTIVGSCALECDTATWEVKVGANPQGIRIGVKRITKRKNEESTLSGYLDDAANLAPEQISWYLKNPELKEGDVVGVYWDQTDFPMLNFSLNGKLLPDSSVNRIRPSQDIYPAVSIQSGSSCEFGFDEDSFVYPPVVSKFKGIVCATSLI